jgi:hypothetical protein
MTANRTSSAVNRRKRLTWLGILLGLILLGYELSILSVDLRLFADDYVEYWAAGRLNLTGGNPYATDQLLPLERAAGRTTEVLMMWNPPYTLALVTPLAVPAYPLSRLIWLLLNLTIILMTTHWTWQLYSAPAERRWLAYIVAFTFFPTVIMLRMGQIGALLLLGVVGFMRYERKGRDWLAGAFLALLAIKPHLLYLAEIAILLWAVSRRRWRIVGGAAAALLAAMLIALASNPQVIGQYLAATAADSPLVWATPTFGSLLRTIFGFEVRWLQFVPMGPGIVWLALYGRRRGLARSETSQSGKAGWLWASQMPLLLLVSVTTTAFGWSFDQVVLLPAVLVVAHRMLMGQPFVSSAAPQPMMTENTGEQLVSTPPDWPSGHVEGPRRVRVRFSEQPRRAAILIAAAYLLFNAASWALFSRASDFWLIWLAPALLAWYLYACDKLPAPHAAAAIADR